MLSKLLLIKDIIPLATKVGKDTANCLVIGRSGLVISEMQVTSETLEIPHKNSL